MAYKIIIYPIFLLLVSCGTLGEQKVSSSDTVKGDKEQHITQNMQIFDVGDVMLIAVLATSYLLIALSALEYKYPWVELVQWALIVTLTGSALYKLMF